jgi:hypothetical protein
MARMSAVHRADAEARQRMVAVLEASLGRQPGVAFAVVFGSFVEGRDFRDVDLGVWTTPSAGPRIDLELATALSQELGVPVDVRRLNDAPVSFLFHALRGRVVCVRDERRLADLMERTARDYHDRAPLLRRATREAFGA